jgi:hypothetical protein
MTTIRKPRKERHPAPAAPDSRPPSATLLQLLQRPVRAGSLEPFAFLRTAKMLDLSFLQFRTEKPLRTFPEIALVLKLLSCRRCVNPAVESRP